MKCQKGWKVVIGVCALVLVFALPAGAQMQGSAKAQSQASGISPLSLEEGVLGKDVRTRKGEEVGTIDDVVFNRQGRISHYLVDVGGFLRTGEKIVALNSDQVQFSGQDLATFNGTRADLENMPEVDPYEWIGYRGYYGRGSGYDRYGSGQGSYSRPYSGTYARGYMGEGYDQGRGDQYQERQEQDRYGYWRGGQPYPQQYPRRGFYDRGPGMTRQGPGAQLGSMAGLPRRGISSDIFLSAQVINPQNQNIGEVKDLIMDPQRGRITEVVIGVGDKKVLVPINQLRLVGPGSVMYRGTEAQLDRMPEYQEGQGGPVIGAGIPEQRAGGAARGQQ